MDIRQLIVGRSVTRSLVRGLVTGAILLAISRFAFTPVRANGISMEPTYEQGTLMLVNRLSYNFGDPARGDIVAIRLAGGRAYLVKRVVALPGERFRIEGGTVFVDGRPLDEPYVRHRSPWEVAETTLEPNEYFVVGDNRGMPAKQHDFGVVQRDRISGKVVY